MGSLNTQTTYYKRLHWNARKTFKTNDNMAIGSTTHASAKGREDDLGGITVIVRY
jgi:hypothetical protein